MRTPKEIDDLFAKLAEKGEEAVKRDLAQEVYNEKAPLVSQWLAERETARLRDREEKTSQQFTEQTKLARDSRNAAWVAAIAAMISAAAAVWAFVVR